MKSKISSRKFWVWIAGLVFVAYTIFSTKTVSPELITFMTFNQMFYVGGNSFSKYMDKKNE